MFIFDLSILVI